MTARRLVGSNHVALEIEIVRALDLGWLEKSPSAREELRAKSLLAQ